MADSQQVSQSANAAATVISPLASASHHRLEASIPEDRAVTGIPKSGGETEHSSSASVEEPFPTRRTRRPSVSERAMQAPTQHGTIISFCRNKGHGFVEPDGGGEPLFIHISDIDGEWVPVEGDKVSYKLCAMPPKMEKFQAVHVRIINLAPGAKHEHWDSTQ